MKVAVVDDDSTVRTLITEFLEDEGCDVIHAGNPDELSGIESCDAIIMDVMIGHNRTRGIDYIREQRDKGKIARHALVVFISNFGRSGDEIRKSLEQVGSYVWLDKPIDMTELDYVVRSAISGRSK